MLSKKTFEYLAQNQTKLDKYILEKHNLKEIETLHQRLLAFLIELAEFINEQRDFKYWSNKKASAKAVLLEEYIDGIHFLISIGNTLKVKYEDFKYVNKYLDQELSLTDLYLDCFVVYSNLIAKRTVKNFFAALTSYLILADRLKFSENDIIVAYNAKNKINFERQENNY